MNNDILIAWSIFFIQWLLAHDIALQWNAIGMMVLCVILDKRERL
ncbi:hypothetical protein [Methylobacter sp.]